MTLLPSFCPITSMDRPAHQLAPPSSICLTGVMFSEGTLDVSRSVEMPTTPTPPASMPPLGEDPTPTTFATRNHSHERLFGTIRYRIFRPRQLHMLPAPLVVIHGGPGVPSNYLMNLVNVVTDRTVIFYDQLGCGRSSRPLEKEAYSIESSVDDLRALLDHWKLKNYHLFGHSFGGIIAFEFLKYKITSKTSDVCKDSNVATTATATSSTSSSSSLDDFHNTACLSVILSSVPTETKLVQSESERLLHLIREQGCDVDQIAATFSQTHECRVIPTPLALLDAYAQAGSSVWRGISAIPTYKATLETNLSTSNDTEQPMQELLNIACCILWGQYDFVTEPCVVGWNKLFANVQSTLLAGCSHHGLLENEQLYGDVIVAFLEDHDL